MKNIEAFEKELEHLINKHDIDTELNTPDYIIAGTLTRITVLMQDMFSGRDRFFNLKAIQETEINLASKDIL